MEAALDIANSPQSSTPDCLWILFDMLDMLLQVRTMHHLDAVINLYLVVYSRFADVASGYDVNARFESCFVQTLFIFFAL